MADSGKGGPDHVNFLTLMKKMRQPVIPSDEPRDCHATYGLASEAALHGSDRRRLFSADS